MSSRLDVATLAAQEAGRELLALWPSVLADGDFGTKSSDTDPVTRADTAAQEIVAGRLGAAFPDDELVGEEGLRHSGGSGWRWAIDPLDGTVNFLYGRDDWAVSIAGQDAGGTAVAVVHAPVSGRLYTAVRGEGAWLGSRRLRVGSDGVLGTAVVGTGFSYTSLGRSYQGAVLARLLPLVADIRRSGSAALDLAAVAAGALDAFYEDDLSLWDWAAGALLASEAGALVRPLPGLDGRSGVLAARPELMSEIVGLVLELQGHTGQPGTVLEQPVLDLGIAGGGECRAGLLVVEVAARDACVRVRADGQPCLGHGCE
ncbi:MAG TPA: inositol monophosphatase family protein [Streptosporangiaceae bacterium]|nr:inositol monophosphatase family protein [Streptosporangiaceae bacterium]